MLDLALSFRRHGYLALPPLWREHDADGVPTRLLGHRALVVRGEAGARLFYDTELTERSGVVPRPLGDLLFGAGAVHGLDGKQHRLRKGLFLAPLSVTRMPALADALDAQLSRTLDRWPDDEERPVFDELARDYGLATLEWSGIRMDPVDGIRLSHQLAAIVDGFGFSPLAYAKGWSARLRANAWARDVVHETRSGRRHAEPGTILHVLGRGAGADLPLPVAAVELLNVLRPAVAVAWLGTFAVLRLVENPEHGAVMRDPAQVRARWAFAQEVRRTTPFVPALVARVRRETSWHGHRLHTGDLLVLDVPAVNHDPDRWTSPEAFRPERMIEQPPSPHDLVPQGGGDVATGHRCPGEDAALTLLDRTLFQFAQRGFTARTARPDRTRIPTVPSLQVRLTCPCATSARRAAG